MWICGCTATPLFLNQLNIGVYDLNSKGILTGSDLYCTVLIAFFLEGHKINIFLCVCFVVLEQLTTTPSWAVDDHTKCDQWTTTPSVSSGRLHQVWAVDDYTKCEQWTTTPSVSSGRLHQVWAVDNYTKCEQWTTTPSVSSGQLRQVWAVDNYAKCKLHRVEDHQVWAAQSGGSPSVSCAEWRITKCELRRVEDHQVWAAQGGGSPRLLQSF